MKKLIVLFMFLAACGKDSNPDYVAKATEWQGREASAVMIESRCPDTGNLFNDIVAVIDQYHIEYLAEEGDFWQTSSQTHDMGHGDCEDLATHTMRLLTDSCLVDKYDIDVRVRILETGKWDHAVAVIYYGTSVFQVDGWVVQTFEYPEPVVVEFDREYIF